MTALSDVLSMLARDARRIAVSADAEVTTTTRAGVVSVRVSDGGVTLLSATLDTRPRAEAPRAEQLAFAAMLAPAPVAVVRTEAPREPDAPAAVEAPAPPRDEHNGIAVGDVVQLDDEDIRVTVSDEFGWQGVTVATTPRGRPLATVHCDWDDIERVGDRAWRTRPTREKLRTAVDEGAPVSKGAKKAAKKAAKPKAPKAPAAPELPQGDDAPEVRLWIREAEWDGLDENTRTEFEEPIGGSGVDWQGREGFVTALVPADEILTALRGMAAAVGIRLHQGDEPPAVKVAKAKRAAKTTKAGAS